MTRIEDPWLLLATLPLFRPVQALKMTPLLQFTPIHFLKVHHYPRYHFTWCFTIDTWFRGKMGWTENRPFHCFDVVTKFLCPYFLAAIENGTCGCCAYGFRGPPLPRSGFGWLLWVLAALHQVDAVVLVLRPCLALLQSCHNPCLGSLTVCVLSYSHQ